MGFFNNIFGKSKDLVRKNLNKFLVTRVYSEDDELREALMFHPALVNMILEGKEDLINEEWLVNNLGEEYKYLYTGGVKHRIVVKKIKCIWIIFISM